MEIAALVCNKKLNYDSTFQAYSIYEYLKGQGNQVQIIDYNFLKDKTSKKNEMLYKFLNQNTILTLNRYKSLNQIEQNLPLADKYIVVNGNYSDLTIQMNADNSIAYRAKGVSSPELDYLRKNYSKLSTSFDLNNDVIKKVVDPIFLLSKEEWYDIINQKSNINVQSDYVLIYSEVVTKGMIDYANTIAQNNNCKVYIVSDKVEGLFYKGKRLSGVEPFDLACLIYNAHDIVTSCDDGIKMSVLFEKNVHIFTTQLDEQIELIDELGLEKRVVNDIESVLSSPIDYIESNKFIQEVREDSFEFLKI